MKVTRKVRMAVVFALLILWLVPFAASAASLKDIIKIGVVDMKLIWKEYASKSSAANSLRKKKAEYAQKMRAELKILRKMRQELKDGLSGMSDGEKRRRTLEIEYKRNELMGRIARWNRLLEKEERALSGPINLEIRKIVRDVASTHGVKIVIDKSNVVYYDYSALDLTEYVRKRVRLILSRRKQY